MGNSPCLQAVSQSLRSTNDFSTALSIAEHSLAIQDFPVSFFEKPAFFQSLLNTANIVAYSEVSEISSFTAIVYILLFCFLKLQQPVQWLLLFWQLHRTVPAYVFVGMQINFGKLWLHFHSTVTGDKDELVSEYVLACGSQNEIFFRWRSKEISIVFVSSPHQIIHMHVYFTCFYLCVSTLFTQKLQDLWHLLASASMVDSARIEPACAPASGQDHFVI